MKRTAIYLAVILATILLIPGCGGHPTLTMNTPINAGPVTINVKSLKAAKTIEGINPMESQYDIETGRMITKTETTKPKHGMFLLMTYDVKNETEQSVMLPEPQIRTAQGEYAESNIINISMKYDFGDKDVGSFLGADLKPGELRKDVFSLYDVPSSTDLEFVLAEGYKAGNFAEAFQNAATKKTFYVISSVPRPLSKAVIVEGKFTFE